MISSFFLLMISAAARQSLTFMVSPTQLLLQAIDTTLKDTQLMAQSNVAHLFGRLKLSGFHLTGLSASDSDIFRLEGDVPSVHVSSSSVSSSDFSGPPDGFGVGFIYAAKLTDDFVLRDVAFNGLVLRREFALLWIAEGDDHTLALKDVAFRGLTMRGINQFIRAVANTNIEWNNVILEDNVEHAPEGGFPYRSLVYIVGDKYRKTNATISSLSVVNNTRWDLLSMVVSNLTIHSVYNHSEK